MARFTLGLVTGMAIATVLGAALGIRASSSDADLHEAAVAAGVDEQDLRGAVNSVGVDPYTYLRWEGRLPSLPPSATVSPPAPTSGVWARLALCESTGNWHVNSGNGYFGGLQQDMSFWIRYGGLSYAPRPDLASPAAQIAVAERGLAVQGWGAWPNCSKRLGLR